VVLERFKAITAVSVWPPQLLSLHSLRRVAGPALETLHVCPTHLTVSDLASAITASTNLKCFTVNGCLQGKVNDGEEIGDAWLEVLSTALGCCRLTHLTVFRCEKATTAGIHKLLSVCTARLIELSLFGSSATELAMLSKGSFPRLVSLNLDRMRALTPKAVSAALFGCPMLENLTIFNQQVGEEIVAALRKLQLKSLTLHWLQSDFLLSTFKLLVDACRSLHAITMGGKFTIHYEWLKVVSNTTSAATLKQMHICAPCTVSYDDFMNLFGACPALCLVARWHPNGIWCAKLTRDAWKVYTQGI